MVDVAHHREDNRHKNTKYNGPSLAESEMPTPSMTARANSDMTNRTTPKTAAILLYSKFLHQTSADGLLTARSLGLRG